MSFERLIAEHTEIDRALVRLQMLVARDAPDFDAVTDGLNDLSREVSSHFAHEDSFLYSRMIAGPNAESSAVARAFIENFACLRRDWECYLGEWNSERIATDWAGFRQESGRMATRLAQRVRAESELLHATALKTDAISPQARRAVIAA